jgi:hypothetical protein
LAHLAAHGRLEQGADLAQIGIVHIVSDELPVP